MLKVSATRFINFSSNSKTKKKHCRVNGVKCQHLINKCMTYCSILVGSIAIAYSQIRHTGILVLVDISKHNDMSIYRPENGRQATSEASCNPVLTLLQIVRCVQYKRGIMNHFIHTYHNSTINPVCYIYTSPVSRAAVQT